MPDKSPRQAMSKKSGKSLKQKRTDKKPGDAPAVSEKTSQNKKR